jgi:hypothetical protein
MEARPLPPKPLQATVPAGHSRERLHLKFHEGTAVRWRNNQWTSLRQDDLTALHAVFSRYPGVQVQRLFTRPEAVLDQEKATIEAQARRQQADFNLYYRLVLPPGTRTEALLDDLNALPIVELAYAEPLPAPPPRPPAAPQLQGTPNFQPLQTYLNPAPGESMRCSPGRSPAAAGPTCGRRTSSTPGMRTTRI